MDPASGEIGGAAGRRSIGGDGVARHSGALGGVSMKVATAIWGLSGGDVAGEAAAGGAGDSNNFGAALRRRNSS
jgi:hypothetical protein